MASDLRTVGVMRGVCCQKETGVVSTLLLWGCALLGQGEDSSSPPPKVVAEVQRLVQELDDASQAKRDAAEKALVGLGDQVLPLLPTVTPRTPAETKERLGRVRSSLEKSLSEANSRPTEVTLKGDLALREVFETITKQTGNRFSGAERRATSVQLSLEKQPFWAAVDQVLDQGNLDIDAYGGEANMLVLVPRAEGAVPRAGRATYAGVFRFEPLRVETRRDLRMPSVNTLRLTMGVAWEPRLTPILLRQPIDKITAEDDQGKSLVVQQEEAAQVLSATAESGMSGVELGIPLALPDRSAKRIRSLRGHMTALVPGRLESFEFADLEKARDVEQQRAGVAVILERVRQNGDLWEVRVRVRYEAAGEALESHRGWVYSNPAHIVDAKGERLESLGANEGGRDENEVGIALLFDLPQGPKGCKFVYQTPASMLYLPVEYELKDIELP